MTNRPGQLDGIRVLDLCVWRPGPYATCLLGEIGAEVIKVEPPGGDPMRAYPDLFARININKKSVQFDLKDAEQRASVLELASAADVVVEGFRPGVVDRLGVGYERVAVSNPSVIYCSISGLGQSGPMAQVPGHDLNYLAWAGALAPDGAAPALPAFPVADLAAGMTAAFAVSAALVRRAHTGEGERIDVSMMDVLATWTGVEEPVTAATGGRAPVLAGYGTFATADGYVTLAIVSEDHFWRSLCGVLGLSDLADIDFAGRLTRTEELGARLSDRIGRYRRDELVTALLDADVPVAPVHTRAEMVAMEHLRQRGAVTDGPTGELISGYPVVFSSRPAHQRTSAPALDAHRGQGFTPR